MKSEEVRRGSGGNIGLNGAIKTPLAGGDLSANTTLQQSDYNGGTDYAATATLQNYSFTSHNRNGELGANYQRGLGAAQLDIELLQRLGHSTSTQLVDDSGVAEVFSNFTDTGESISHFTLTYPLTPHLSVESGAEVAYNFLNGTSLYTQDGAVVTVPSSDVNVNEMREEVFAQASWQIGRALVLDTGMRAEYSTISERGDVSQSRSFFYLKPRALLTWTMSPNALLRLRVEHQLGQLDFGDFISSVSLNQGNVTAGNPDVKPDQHWQFEADYERHFWGQGSLTFSLLHQEISNILDMKPVFDPSGDYDTRGNIGNGRTDRLSVAGAIPTDKFRPLKGGRITLSLAWQDSAVKDPLTGVTRRLTYDDAQSYSVGFLQDLEAWKSTPSINYDYGWNEIGYRPEEIDRFAARRASAPATVQANRQPEYRLFGQQFPHRQPHPHQRLLFRPAQHVTSDAGRDRDRLCPADLQFQHPQDIQLTGAIRHRRGGSLRPDRSLSGPAKGLFRIRKL